MRQNRAIRVTYWVTFAVGLGLALAPAVFQMFSRAPSGGQMIEEFEPYMTVDVIGGFAGDLALIDKAVTDLQIDSAATGIDVGYYSKFAKEWPAIYEDMGGMLTTMDDNLDNFEDVNALPPFSMFPWFFVAPGLIAAVVAVVGLKSHAKTSSLVSVAAIGIGLIAAPFVFQMFSRAPSGGDMINDFKPLMTKERVQTMQGYFLVIGAGEGNLRNEIVSTLSKDEVPESAIQFSVQWPRISNEMAPMIGVMSDNVDNFNDVVALPAFPLFPWFFVAPGAVLVAVAGSSLRRSSIIGSSPRQRDTKSLTLQQGETL